MDLIKPFLIGGSVISGAKLVAKYVSPALAPLVGGMPTGMITTFFLTSDKDRKLFYSGYMYSSFLLFLAVVLANILSNNSKLEVNYISAISIVVWALISYIAITYLVPKTKSS